MTLARKIRIHALAGGICAWCLQPVEVTGAVVYDHRVPLALLGPDTDENLRPLHKSPCDKLKTAFDKKQIAKAIRLRKTKDGTRRPRKKIPTRRFAKGPKRSFPSRPFQPRKPK